MSRLILKALPIILLTGLVSGCHKAAPRPTDTTIPPRAEDAIGGSEFARSTAAMTERERQQAAEQELLRGNIPEFLRQLKPVNINKNGRTVTIWVMPDYLAIGSDQDFLRMPLSSPVALAVAERYGCTLPTSEIVDAIYAQAEVKLEPKPLPASDQMRSIDYFVRHQEIIESQLKPGDLGRLTAGHKKDLVISDRILTNPKKAAIYGWHRPDGTPIQPLSTFHGENYADYSHGVRLISRLALVDGEVVPISEALGDPALSVLRPSESPDWSTALALR